MRSVWSGREDLNLRPYRPERYALPSCATPRPRVSVAQDCRMILQPAGSGECRGSARRRERGRMQVRVPARGAKLRSSLSRPQVGPLVALIGAALLLAACTDDG